MSSRAEKITVKMFVLNPPGLQEKDRSDLIFGRGVLMEKPSGHIYTGNNLLKSKVFLFSV